MTKRTAAIFVDGANIHAVGRALGFDIDYGNVLKHFAKTYDITRAFYYTSIIEDSEYLSIQPLLDYLDFNGWTVITNAAKEFVDPATGQRRYKRGINVELTVDALRMAGFVDEIIILSGDGSYRALVEALQQQTRVRVTVGSTRATQPPMVADELRRQADAFLDVNDLRAAIERPRTDRAPRHPRLQAAE